MYNKIEDYGVIGDMHGIALVSKEGSVDYCCLPHIDSPTVFAKLLDDEKGGHLTISPAADFTADQSYLPDTNILKTTFTTSSGKAELTDFMSVSLKDSSLYESESHEICRLVKGIEGVTEFKLECFPRPNYALSSPKIEKRGSRYIIRDGKETFSLIVEGANIAPEIINDGVLINFKIAAGKEAMFMFTYGESASNKINPDLLKNTKDYWQNWLHSCEAGKCKLYGEHNEMINRSLLLLKLLSYIPSGAIAAAATTSLPEAIGGERNWDYRFTWLRDSSFTLKALFSVGHIAETENYIRWLQGIYRKYGRKNLQIMYGLDGQADLTEKELKHLKGYKDSRPVRIGNGAYSQKQLDIYGEIMDSALRLSDFVGHIDEELWPFFRRICNTTIAEWEKPDAGIWEVRGGNRHFVYSKLMCWVALDRGIKIAERYGFVGETELWEETKNKIKEDILKNGFNPNLNSFVQHYNTEALDASLLMIPLIGFLPVNDPKVQGTIAAVQNKLMRDGFLLRYTIDDGLKGEEGSFIFCNFWLVECLALSGKLDEAKELLQKTIGSANHLGLFSEEYDPKNKTMLGNFPQAFTHIGLINAVNALIAAEQPKSLETEKSSVINRLSRLLPAKTVLNSGGKKVKGTGVDISADLKRTLNNLQGAFFDIQSGKVDYEKMRYSDEYKKYTDLAKQLNSFDLSILKTDDQKKAFWINIYNILIIHGVIELEIKNSVQEVFKFFRRISYNIGGYNFTPDDIEHGILRKNVSHPLLKLRQFNWLDKRRKFVIKKLDPRVHCALVCASSSCPPIEFYSPEKIDPQLDVAVQSFLNRRGAILDKKNNLLHLSQIFLWFRGDFKNPIEFILPYLSDGSREYIVDKMDTLKVDYLPYNWELNRSIK
jgi:GH15 family glucan-1,4-alpha-glucosidase